MTGAGDSAITLPHLARVILAHEPTMRLGPLTIAPALRQIVHADGRDELVEPKVMEVLVVLLRADGGILTRDELCDAAWEGRIVGDDAINRVLSRVRRLSEGIGAGVFHLETITRVGYRLLAAEAFEICVAVHPEHHVVHAEIPLVMPSSWAVPYAVPPAEAAAPAPALPAAAAVRATQAPVGAARQHWPVAIAVAIAAALAIGVAAPAAMKAMQPAVTASHTQD